MRRVDDDRLSVPDDPTDVFDAIIVGSPRVCQECFSRLRHFERFPYDYGHAYEYVLAYVDVDLPDGARWDLLDREFYEAVKDRRRFDRDQDGSTTVCGSCGTTAPHRSGVTRDRDQARHHAINLGITLAEFGIRHDWVVLVQAVDRLKRHPATAGDDHTVFERATAAAVNVVLDDEV